MMMAPSLNRVTSSCSPDMSTMSQAKHRAKAKAMGDMEPKGNQRNFGKLFLSIN
jgi:hypothetical protein